VSVAFGQIDRVPDTKTGTESDDERLQYADCTVEKSHKLFPALFAPQVAGENEKPSSCSACAPVPQEKGIEKYTHYSRCETGFVKGCFCFK